MNNLLLRVETLLANKLQQCLNSNSKSKLSFVFRVNDDDWNLLKAKPEFNDLRVNYKNECPKNIIVVYILGVPIVLMHAEETDDDLELVTPHNILL